MARLETDFLSKKSNKFENFLKKNLDEQTFVRIRGYEACILCSDKESKAFKFIVLSDECIYFTENPPRTISRAVRLADILSIELLDSLPEFLSGQEQLNTQHILVTYLSSSSAAVDSADGRASPVVREPSSAADEDDAATVGNGGTGDAAGAVARRQIQGSQGDNSIGLSQSMPTLTLKSLLKSSRDDGGSTAKKVVTINEAATQLGSASSPFGRDRASRSGENLSTAQALDDAKSAFDEAGLLQRSSLSNRSMPPPYQQQLGRRGSIATASSGGEGENGGSNSIRDSSSTLPLGQRVMHIYMLRSTSTMFSLLQSAASNCIIRNTMMLDADYRQRVAMSPRSNAAIDKVETQFACLANELIDPENTLEQIFTLVQELKTAAEKDFYLKKLFWRSPDLFAFMVRLLQTYLPRSPACSSDDAATRARRADEFELMILTAQTLELMFRETEILPARLRVLRFGGGRLAADLIAVLTCLPDLPTPFAPPTGRPTASGIAAVNGEAASWRCLDDLELHELQIEFTNAATAALFELILIAEQANWGGAPNSFFNVGWVMRVMEDLHATEKFLERLIAQAMRLVQPSRQVALTPQWAVLLFKQFTVLRTVVTCSPRLAAFIRNTYTEEFKYYIKAAVLAEKLPLDYPIARRAMLLVEDVMAAVLQRRTLPQPDLRPVFGLLTG